MPGLILVFLLLQGTSVEPLYEKAIDETYAISLVRTISRGDTALYLRLVDRKDGNRFWDLETFRNYQFSYTVIRSDQSSVVFGYGDDYGFNGGFLKLFFDVPSRKVVKRIEFKDPSFGQLNSSEMERALGVPSGVALRLREPFAPRPLPEELLRIALPQSTYDEFARARPSRVPNGPPSIKERIEPYQISDEKIWFGKSFYDGEGFSGVGAIGYLDRSNRKLSFLRIPEVADWSASSLLIEGDTLWAGLVRHPEGADRSGGLIRHDLKSGRTRVYPVDDVIFRIMRSQDAIYLTTSNGIYALRNDRFIRYRVEPDINNKPVIISEQL